MKVYYLETSHRVGHTLERPSFEALHNQGEYVLNSLDFQEPIGDFFISNSTLFRVYAVFDARGEHITESRCFSNLHDAIQYRSEQQRKPSSKRIVPYTMELVQVYDTITEIPLREFILEEYDVGHQIAEHSDYRLNRFLSLEQKMDMFQTKREEKIGWRQEGILESSDGDEARK